MIGPTCSGWIALIIMICQPAWQLPIRHGLPSVFEWRVATSSTKRASASHTSSIVSAGHRLRQKADEIARMAGPERHPDFAVVLHAADPGSVAGTRVEDNKRALARIDRHPLGRHDAHQSIIDRARQCPPVEHQFDLETQYMRQFVRIVLDRVVAAAAQDIEQEN